MPQKFTSPSNRLAFYTLVWEVVKQIPKGRVATYGQIASLIPPPEGTTPQSYRAWSARWVGGAMAECPKGVPWQRVINSQGKISLRKGTGPQIQRELLESEGVVFDHQERVDQSIFGWDGPSTEWLEAQGMLPPLED